MSLSRAVRVGVAMVAVVALAGGVAGAPASAMGEARADHDPNVYLALGDSVPFGYNPKLVTRGVNPDVFVGFPELVADRLRPRQKLFNAACPGETSTSFITGTRPDNGCQDYRQLIGQLHVSYSGSQLVYAEAFLAAHRRTGLVTIMIGANDLFLLQDSCAASADPTCIASGLPAVLATLGANLSTIYGALYQAGFSGHLVAVTYYSLNYADPAGTAVATALDDTISAVTRAFGGTVADGFGEFQAAAAAFGGDPCAAGLLIRLPDGSCNVHPSPKGAALLADAVLDVVSPNAQGRRSRAA